MRWRVPAVSSMLCSGLLQSLTPLSGQTYQGTATSCHIFLGVTYRMLCQWLCLSSHTKLGKARLQLLHLLWQVGWLLSPESV